MCSKIKVLFVCNQGRIRSRTAANIFKEKYDCRFCGTDDNALVKITDDAIDWADVIICMMQNNADKIYRDSIVLNIPDLYDYMCPILMSSLDREVKNAMIESLN